MHLARANGIVTFPIDPGAVIPGTLSGYEGYPVAFTGAAGGAVSVPDTANAGSPVGVILRGADYPELVSVALASGGLAGTVRVKLGQPVTVVGSFLKLVYYGGDICAFGPDTGSGSRVVMAQALETGAIGELIEATLFKPIVYAS